jgi:type I restriction enzyme, S subunit
MDKRSLSERDICTKFITPTIVSAGWDLDTQIREEVSFTKGRIIVRGKLVSRGQAKRADYVLYYKPNIPLAIIEAKDNSHSVGDAPDAIGRLRRFILDLAVRSELVPQDPKDEPASELLRRIAKETARLLKNGDIKKPGARRQLVKDEIWPVPPSWSFVPLELLAAPTGLFTDGDWVESKDQDPNGGVRLTQLADVGVGEYRDRSSRFMNATTAARLNCTFLTPGDILIARMPDPLGRACIFPGDPKPSVTVVDVAVLRLGSPNFVGPYVVLAINSPQFARNVESKAAGTTRSRISRGNLSLLPFPLPPLAEQHRIVAKVDELMALCDRLETARADREGARDRLAAASLARLNTPDPETFQADARFALNALPALTTRPEQIKQFRQTILNLAVRGKLVPQDPKDQPASELLKRIDKMRARLLTSGYPNPDEARTQIKKLAEQSVPEVLDALPIGWAWATLLQCSALVIDCKNKTAPYSASGVRLIRTTNVRDGRMNLNDQKFVDQKTYELWSARCTPEPGDILITREAPMGEVCLVPPGEQICLGQRMMLARLVPDTIDRNFMLYSLRDPRLMDRVQDKPIGATVQHLRVGGVETLLVPLPPVSEQHRIVAKVDELMALCDQLGASIDETAATRRRLLDALLAEALAPAERELEAVA